MSVFGLHLERAVRLGPMGLSEALRLSMQCWCNVKAAICDPYRPELHYMRGPGPKWREKHATAIAAR